MKATDFRIGNLWSDNAYNVHTMDIDTLRYLLNGEDTTRVHGVELGDDVMRKMGFDNTNCIYLGIDDSSKYLQVVRGTYDCLILSSDNSISAVLKPVRYVHEMQNLYFALVGKELMFNL